jgi:hypothetical protein
VSRLLLALVLVFAASCKDCGKGPVGPIAHIVIDCIAQDRAKLDALGAELQPLIAAGDWTTFEAKANGGGAEIGGCIAAELINKYLAPPPGNAAPSPENGQNAKAAMDRVRANFKGATFKTSQGEL